jgi:hypothetical protein
VFFLPLVREFIGTKPNQKSAPEYDPINNIARSNFLDDNAKLRWESSLGAAIAIPSRPCFLPSISDAHRQK